MLPLLGDIQEVGGTSRPAIGAGDGDRRGAHHTPLPLLGDSLVVRGDLPPIDQPITHLGHYGSMLFLGEDHRAVPADHLLLAVAKYGSIGWVHDLEDALLVYDAGTYRGLLDQRARALLVPLAGDRVAQGSRERIALHPALYQVVLGTGL